MADLHLDLLDRVRIAAPCPMRWDDLDGDGHVRHCGRCDLDVYNFSDMTRREVESILRERGVDRVCATFHRRPDGTMITSNCPVGLRAARRRMRALAGRLAAVLGLAAAAAFAFGRRDGADAPDRIPLPGPIASARDWLRTPAPPPAPGRMALGEVCVVPPPARNTGVATPEETP